MVFLDRGLTGIPPQWQIAAVCSLFLATGSTQAVERQTVHGHVPPAVGRLRAVGHLNPTNQLNLALGLPLRNRGALTNLLRQLYEPTSAQFHRYLSPGEFTEQFGPSAQDYEAAVAFAKANGFTVTATHANRMLLGVRGTVADVEKTLHVKMRLYPHPAESRTFYAPDEEPTLDSTVPLLHISGLDNYTRPHPMSLRERTPGQVAVPHVGSGPNGEYMGRDFRTAYVPGTTLTGAGQVVGLFELCGYYASDITAYEAGTGLAAVPLQNVLIDGFDGSPGDRRPGSPNEEVALDIEMVVSMAPGLSKVLVYEASPNATAATIDHLLNRMATDNLAKQLSCSWGFDIDETTQQIFLQYAAQGQSFYLASGDSGAFSGVVAQPSDNPYITVVGGTSLTTDSAHKWVSETTWSGSSGGISTVYAIPDWQQGIDMSANQGSISMRNVPDVAMVADNVLAIADEGRSLALVGTSIAAPLWAGFTALVNERAATQGKPPVGFLNPMLYTLGKGSRYTSVFHDITTGNNVSTNSASLFSAVAGYDLCTGWGTPNGTNLIEALLESPAAGLAVTPPLGFLAEGPAGGPFQMTSATYILTNTGTAALNWTAAKDANWLDVSPSGGTLPAGSGAVVMVSLNLNASKLLLGSYSANVSFTDLSTGNHQERQFTLSVGNSGFETGDFTDWTFTGQTDANFVNSLDASQWHGTTAVPGVDDSEFVHSGIYGAFLGQTNSLGFLSQALPTISGQRYVLSLWLANPAVGTPNEFQVLWNGTTLFDQNDMDQFGWTNLQYVVSASSDTGTLQFGFRNDQNAFALDDISLQMVPSPEIQSVSGMTAAGFNVIWSALPQVTYQVQYTSDLASDVWLNLGDAVVATGSTMTVTDPAGTVGQRFYRVLLLP